MSETEHSGAPQGERGQPEEEAEERSRLTAQRQQLYGAATRQMLEAAQLKPGDHVLDIAAGTGDQSIQAARMVGPLGSVLATDISQEMLIVAAQLAQQEGVGNVTTRVMNAEQLDLPENGYDAAISRLGLMLIPRKAQALAEIQRVLKPGGRLAALVWSKPERNPLFAPYIAIVVQSLKAAQSGEAGFDPFSLADTTVFARMLTEAGFRQAQVHAIPLTFRFPSFEVLAQWWGSRLDTAIAALGPQQGRRALDDIRQHVRQFEGPQGIEAPAELLLGMGMK